MFISRLDYKKAYYVSRHFDKKTSSEVELAGTTFKIYEPNFNGGSILSHCRQLDEKDFDIINELEVNELTKLEKEIDYLKNLIQKRRTELLTPRTITELIAEPYNEGNKKMIRIFVQQYTLISDIYGDEKRIDEQVLEYHTRSNTKPFKEEVDKLIKELNYKYGLVKA